MEERHVHESLFAARLADRPMSDRFRKTERPSWVARCRSPAREFRAAYADCIRQASAEAV
jgi:hypothetical protein